MLAPAAWHNARSQARGVLAPHRSSLPRLLTFMPKACMRVATSLPMRPSPSTPSVFPFSSMPMY